MAKIIRFSMEFLCTVLRCTRPLSDKGLDVLYTFFMGRHQTLPPINDKILLLSATELTERIRKRKLKAEDVMKSYIKRIKEVDPLINACIDQRFDDALSDAREVDRFLNSTNKSEETIAKETPLLGVPFSCKESLGVKGLAMTQGLVIHRDHKAPSDAETVAHLRKAGAIPVVVTNVPILCMWWESANQAFGMTKNPYNHIRTVGGSSGGESAIITAAAAPFGIGTDIGGSIRTPSSFCGIYGHKPSRGVISNHKAWPDQNKDTAGNMSKYRSTGPLCRYVQDLKLLTCILAGDTEQKLKLHEKVDFCNVKIYYMEEFPGFLLKATPDIKTSVKKAVSYFQEEFQQKAIELKVEELKDAFTIWECMMLETGWTSFKSLLSQKKESINLFSEFIKSLIQRSDYTWPALYYACIQRRCKDETHYNCLEKFKTLKEIFDDIFKEEAILLLPTHPEPPPHHLLTIPKLPNLAYTCIFNILGYPSSQVPAGFSSGVPIGIQVISSTFQDHLTIAAAEELDKVFGGWVSPCSIQI